MVEAVRIIYQTKDMPHTPNNIKEYVAYKMSVSHLKQHSKIRKPEIVFAKYLSMYLMKQNGYSIGFIAGHFNNEHGTVARGIQKIVDFIAIQKTNDKLILAIQDAVKNYDTWANNIEAKA